MGPDPAETESILNFNVAVLPPGDLTWWQIFKRFDFLTISGVKSLIRKSPAERM